MVGIAAFTQSLVSEVAADAQLPILGRGARRVQRVQGTAFPSCWDAGVPKSPDSDRSGGLPGVSSSLQANSVSGQSGKLNPNLYPSLLNSAAHDRRVGICPDALAPGVTAASKAPTRHLTE